MADPTVKAYGDLTAEDFGETAPAARPAGTNPATGKQFTAGEVLNLFTPEASPEAKEIEPSAAKRALAGAGMNFVNKARGLMGEPAAPSFGLEKDFAGSMGALAPDVAGSMLFPAKIVPQMAYGFASKAMEPAHDPLDRFVAGTKGALEMGAGQGLASGIVRGANAAAGRLTPEGVAAAAAEKRGLDLTAGDVTKNKLLQLAEEKSFGSPSAGQSEQVASLMKSAQDNPITHGVMNAYQTGQGRVTESVNKLDSIIAANPNLQGVVPNETVKALQEIYARSPTTLNNINDPTVRQALDQLQAAAANGWALKGMSFKDLDEMRRILGPIKAKIEQQSSSPSSNINTHDSNRWNKLYKAINQDMENWGTAGASKDALEAHKEMVSRFKNEVLPLREHPVAGKIVDDAYARPEDIIRDITSPRNRTIVKDLYSRLDQEGKNAFDAMKLASRGSREFVKGDSQSAWSRPLAISAGLTAPAWIPYAGAALPWAAAALAAEQGLVHGLNSKVGRQIVRGSPEAAKSPLANAALYSGLRTAPVQGALEAYRQGK